MQISTVDPTRSDAVPTWIVVLLAAACGAVVANLYYAQPLVGPISAAMSMSPAAAGLIVTLTQCGYGLGLLFIVPLADLVENRRLVTTALLCSACALVVAGTAHHVAIFLCAALCIGLSSVAAQVLVPYAAHLAPDAHRGKIVGNVMSGLLLGIMLARPAASIVDDMFGWHAIFFCSAILITLTALLLHSVLPQRRPAIKQSYTALLASMKGLLLSTPLLRRRGFYHACAFGAFSLFWTTVPLLLSSDAFHLSQRAIAVFALVGVSGAIAAPVAGRLADKGWSRSCTALAMLLIAGAFMLMLAVRPGKSGSLYVLVAAAIILDMGVSASLVLSQRAIFAIGPEVRGRLNGMFMAMFFAGGAAGSSVGAWTYASDGWRAVTMIGLMLPLMGLLYFCTERRR
jgi:predicted MFS family arabinose efflux permease